MSTGHPSPAPPSSDSPPHRYTAAYANALELRWQEQWERRAAFRQPNPGELGPDGQPFDASKPKFYCLDMFPYPSGAGLHVGHPEGYTATDIICRYKRMKGFNVLHPMGWDAFGLPAEQYAIQTGVHPAITTRQAIDNFRRQLKRFGFSYDWSREFGTIDPTYYKWTQWIFLQLYGAWFDGGDGTKAQGHEGTKASSPTVREGPELGRARPIAELVHAFERGEQPVRFNYHAGEISRDDRERDMGSWATLDAKTRRRVIDSYRLAYLAESIVNWCPKLGTVLANDEVIDGRSERGGHPVLRKPMKQWMFRITAYADRLLEGLNHLDWPASTRTMQEEWIGRSEGAEVSFEIATLKAQSSNQNLNALRVFTTRPDTIFGATYMVVAPEHPLVDEILSRRVEIEANSGTSLSAIEAYVKAARNKSEIDRQADTKEKTGVFSGLFCTNPVTKQPIPIWIADYVLMGYGTGAIMAVPAQDERDWDFAKAFNLPIVRTVQPPADWNDDRAFTGDGRAINSGFLNGLSVADAKKAAIDWLEREGLGTRRVNYKFRDWTFSRQRYWGEPFPIVYDREGHHYPVSPSHLPVELPELADYAPVESDDPQPLLAKAGAWVNTTAGQAGVDPSLLPPETPVRRETNTMPGSAGSSWYMLRYCDARNASAFASKSATDYWMGTGTSALRAGPTIGGPDLRAGPAASSNASDPARRSGPPVSGVDLYLGGSEHAVGHLLYSRFWHQVLHDLGHVAALEPFHKLFHQGLITSFAYQRTDKTLVPVDIVWELKYNEDGGGFAPMSAPGSQIVTKHVDVASLPTPISTVLKQEGSIFVTFGDDADVPAFNIHDVQRVTQITAKMSKSLKNVVNPDDVIAEFGADTFRLYEMYMGPLDASKPWNPRDITGCFRFLQRAWRVLISEATGELTLAAQPDATLDKQLHRLIAKVESDIERLAFNTAIAAMIEFVNAATSLSNAKQGQPALTADQARRFALVLSPFAPHMAEELWHKIRAVASSAIGAPATPTTSESSSEPWRFCMHQAWPTHDPAQLQDDAIELAVQIQGKVRAKITVPASAEPKAVEAIALADAAVIKALEGKKVTKVIVVPKKLVNIVVV